MPKRKARSDSSSKLAEEQSKPVIPALENFIQTKRLNLENDIEEWRKKYDERISFLEKEFEKGITKKSKEFSIKSEHMLRYSDNDENMTEIIEMAERRICQDIGRQGYFYLHKKYQDSKGFGNEITVRIES